MTEEQAAAVLRQYVAEKQSTPIKVTNGTKTWTVMPADLGASVDVVATVGAAMEVTHESNFFGDLGRRIKLYFDHKDLPLAVSIDQAKLDSFLAGVAQEVNVEPISAGLAMQGTRVVVLGGRDGLSVDREALADEINSLLVSLKTGQVTLPVTVVDAEVQPKDSQAARDQATTMLSSSVTLTCGSNSWVVTPQQLAGYLEFTTEVKDGVLRAVPSLISSKMTSLLDQIAPSVAKDPIDATFASDGTKAWVVPAVPGETVDPEGTAKALQTAALRPSGRTIAVAVLETDPALTTAKAEAMGIKDRLGTYQTEPYQGTAARRVNVRLTTKYAENVFLAPGQEYNFDSQVGPRTPERGYQKAPGIVGEGMMEDVYGGGICQVSTTLFNAVFEAGLEVLERNNHSLYISHYPSGRDATVAGPEKNFRFRNDTDHYIWIRGASDGVTTRFTIYGTSDGRKVQIKFSGFSSGAARTEETIVDPSLAPGQTQVVRSGQSGRSCSVTRIVTMSDGTVLHDGPEEYSSYYPMMSKITKVGPAATTTTTAPTVTTPPVTTFSATQ